MVKLVANITILNNKKCHIESDEEAYVSLYNLLAFRQPGVEYTALFKRGIIDGMKRLFSKKKQQFDLGLLDRVTKHLKVLGYDVCLLDKRNPLIPNEPLDISERLSKLSLVPREHQIRIADLFPKYQKGIVRAATGSGKTLATAMITAKLNRPTIIFVIGLDLLNQFHELYSNIFDEEIGYVGDGRCDIKRINIVSIWSVGSALKVKKIADDEDKGKKEKTLKELQKDEIRKMLKSTEVFLYDESHVVTCETISAIYKAIDPKIMIGFSGTPFRDDGSDLLVEGILGKQLINVGASELIDAGYLVQPIIKFFDVPKKWIDGKTYAETYKQYIVENDIRNNMIIKQTIKMIEKGYTPLVLFKNIAHGKELLELFQARDVNCELLSGKDKLTHREEVKSMITNNKLQVLIASTILDIGVDIPKLNALVLCGGGKSSIRTLQRVGRVIRTYPGKSVAVVADFCDNVKFLKGHSSKRYQTYRSEKGFKVIKSKNMK